MIKEVMTMKGYKFIAMILLIALLAGCAALGEGASAPASAEELLQAGIDAESEENYEKAMECYQLAADQDDAEAVWSIGNLYYDGHGVEQSYETAMEYFQKAAEMGYVRALDSIGNMYLEGYGVDQDYEKAAENFRQAAELGIELAAGKLKELVDSGYVSGEYLEGLGE